MKTLYDYAVQAHKEGTDFFGEQPRDNARETFELTVEERPEEIQYVRARIAMEGIHERKPYKCGTGVGIYPVNHSWSRISFFSGCHVFEIDVTPEIREELLGVKGLNLSLDDIESALQSEQDRAAFVALELQVEHLEEENAKLKKQLRRQETSLALEELHRQVADIEYYIEHGMFPEELPF